MLKSLIFGGTSFYMVYSINYGFHLYNSLRDALRAIVDCVYTEDNGIIHSMWPGQTYQDSTTKELFYYTKREGVTLETFNGVCLDIDQDFENNQDLMDTLNRLSII